MTNPVLVCLHSLGRGYKRKGLPQTPNSPGFSIEKKQDHNCETLKSNADETINEATMNSSDVERGVVKREGVIDKINVKQLGER